MSQEKQTMTVANDEQGPAPAYLTADFRFLSLLSLSAGVASLVTIGGFLSFGENFVRPYALGGALQLLDISIYIASSIAIATCVSKILLGHRRLADVVPRGNSGILRSVAIVALLVFLRGGIENQARNTMFEDIYRPLRTYEN